MKTKNEILQLDNLIFTIEANVEDIALKPFKYAFLRNRAKFKKVSKERDELVAEMFERWEGDKQTKEGQNEFLQMVDKSEEFKIFLAEETDLDFYTVKLSALEGLEDYDLKVAEALLGTILIDE